MRVLATCRPGRVNAGAQRWFRGTRRSAAWKSAEPAVAVLVFLARSAGAGIVAADLAPGGRVLRVYGACRAIAVPIAREGGRERGAGEVVLPGVRIDVVRLHVGQVLLLFFRRLLHDLNAHQMRGHGLPQPL